MRIRRVDEACGRPNSGYYNRPCQLTNLSTARFPSLPPSALPAISQNLATIQFFNMKWNIIWQVAPNKLSSCIERDWFQEMTSLVPIDSISVDYEAKPLLSFAQPYCIICASCPNQTDKIDLIQYLRRLPKPRVLYHMSDEYGQVGDELYQHCDLVIRNGYKSANLNISADQKFIQLPLGYVSGLRNRSLVYRNSSDRKCCYAFLGTIKHDRESEMLAAFEKLRQPHFVRKTPSFQAATKHFDNSTIAVYKNAVFVPNPKGNWNPECHRLYDALEWGCIPLLRRYSDSQDHENYHDKLLGDHPLPTFDDWEEAVEFAEDLFSNKFALDSLQAEIFAWWQEYKSKLQAEVAGELANLAV
jgi:hypothetical protein